MSGTSEKKMDANEQRAQVTESVTNESAVVAPRTTDLDRLMDNAGEQRGPQHLPVLTSSDKPLDPQYHLHQTTSANMDREDIETVKYLPLQMNTTSHEPSSHRSNPEEEEANARCYDNDVSRG